jgi:RNA polymerase sigma factor (TIGR02999 family)
MARPSGRQGAADSVNDDPVTVIATAIARAESGDAAAKDALFSALYDELHRLAQSHLRRSSSALTISATTLLHEAYLNLAGRAAVAFPDRSRFLGYASKAMRGLIIDYVRHRGAQKRGADLTFTALEDDQTPNQEPAKDLERLGDALEELASVDPPLAELVDLRFFCGFSLPEIAAMRNVSERTTQRDWAKARTLLHRFLDD